MASWAEIERLRRDVEDARRIAHVLLAADKDVLTDWELDFLENIEGWRRDELSILQVEKLVEVRSSAEYVDKIDGQLLSALLRQCYEARFDLPDGDPDEAWIVEVRSANAGGRMRRRDARRLLRLVKRLGLDQ